MGSRCSLAAAALKAGTPGWKNRYIDIKSNGWTWISGSKKMGKKTIKVVKKAERNRHQDDAPKAAGARETARDMVKTVTNWVNEFQQKRRTDTTDALKSLLSETPRPSEI